MFKFTYPLALTPDKEDGGLIISFRDIPEAITQGETIQEALLEATDCLDEAISGRIDDGMDIPVPSKQRKGEYKVSVPLQTAMKTALYIAVKDAGITKVELARRINVNEKEARRMLDPHHGTKLSSLERALIALGKTPELHVL